MALVDGIRNPNASLTFTRDDGTSFTTMSTPETEDYFARIPRRQEQSAPLAMGGTQGAPGAAPVMSDAAPGFTGGSGGASGGATKNLVMVPQGATGGPIASEAPPAQTVSYTERSAVPVSTGNKKPNELALNDGPALSEGGQGGGNNMRAMNLEIGDYARQKQTESEMRGGGPARLVKGGTFQTGMTQKETIEGGKPAESIRAMNDQQLTADLAGISANDAQRQYQGEVSRNMDPYRAAEAEKDDYLASWKREELQKLTDDRAAAERDAGETKIDPQQFWGDKTAGDKIAFVLASAVTGFFNGRAGIQGNQVISAVNKRIDENVNAQIRNLETKKGRVGELGRIYQQSLDKFGNMEIARNAAKARGLLEAEALARQQAAQSGNEVVRAQAEKVIADLAAEREKVHFNNVGKVTQEVDRKFTTTQDKVVGGGGPNWKNIEAISARGTAAHPEAKPGGAQLMDLGGQSFLLNVEPAEGAQIRKKAASINNMDDDVAYLQKASESAVERLMPSAATVAAQNRVAAAMSNLQDMGVLQGNEREEYQKILSNWRSGPEALQGMRSFAHRAGNQLIVQAGGQPVKGK